jgi:Tat protein translocase TatB subunit
MFDIGFSEIVVIAVVALIVIGPERLPKVARTLGHLFGRMQRYVNDVKADISREMELDELRKLQATGAGRRACNRADGQQGNNLHRIRVEQHRANGGAGHAAGRRNSGRRNTGCRCGGATRGRNAANRAERAGPARPGLRAITAGAQASLMQTSRARAWWRR